MLKGMVLPFPLKIPFSVMKGLASTEAIVKASLSAHVFYVRYRYQFLTE